MDFPFFLYHVFTTIQLPWLQLTLFKLTLTFYSLLLQVAFQLSSTGHVPPLVTPEQVGTQVLKYLLDITAEYLGHDQVISSEHCVLRLVRLLFLQISVLFLTRSLINLRLLCLHILRLKYIQVNKAVIAVPAKFSQLQRQATAQAYKNAGLKVL